MGSEMGGLGGAGRRPPPHGSLGGRSRPRSRWHNAARLAPARRAHQAVDEKTHERTQGETGLRQLVLQDRGGTLEALRTQRHVAQTMVDAGVMLS
jgi:hypothetical protein